MSKVTVSGEVRYALPNSMGLGAGGGVKDVVVRIYDQDPDPVPSGLPGGFVNGTSGNDKILEQTTGRWVSSAGSPGTGTVPRR
jgi:hypothetical protein